MSEEISRAEVIRMIRNLVTEKRIATLYIRTNQNRAVMVAVTGGKIITLSSGPRHGEKAIPMLREMSSATVRVDDTAVAYRSDQIPPTPVLLAMLESEAGLRHQEMSLPKREAVTWDRKPKDSRRCSDDC